MGKISFPDFWKYYDQDNINQKEAICLLESAMPQSLLTDEAAWVVKYREPEPKPDVSNPIEVEYDCQLNHGDEGWRLCFTASCAMAAHHADPSISIDEYYARRPKYGDSTDPSAQIRTLQSFGLECKYVQIGSVAKLKEQIQLGYCCPVGILHHSHYTSPSGGGHWQLALGTFEDSEGGGVICHDPYGRLSEIDGGYPETGGTYGKYVKYHWKYWTPRWSVSNDSDGWGMGIRKPGK